MPGEVVRHMGSGWTGDPVVASAGWWLLAWAGVAAVVLQAYGSALAWTVAAVLAVCAVGVLRGERWYVVAASGVLVVFSLTAVVLVLVNVPLVILLAGAIVRLRAAGPDQVADPAAAPAGAACLVAAAAGVLWTAGRVGVGSSWEELLVLTAFLGMPALVLGVAAIGMMLGTPGWAFVATPALVVFGLVASTTRVSGGVEAGWVPMDLALLGSAAFAYVRLLALAPCAAVR